MKTVTGNVYELCQCHKIKYQFIKITGWIYFLYFEVKIRLMVILGSFVTSSFSFII